MYGPGEGVEETLFMLKDTGISVQKQSVRDNILRHGAPGMT